jgi:enamine deaminase RidA (YjgF/YER057c/UK114 family)
MSNADEVYMMWVRKISFAQHDECWVTVAPDEETALAGRAEAAFRELAVERVRRGLCPVYERVYGLATARDEVLALRRRVYAAHGLEPDTPVTFIEGAPVDGASFAGAQLWASLPGREGCGQVTELKTSDGGRGSEVAVEGGRLVFLASVDGADPNGALPAAPAAQAREMFDKAARALTELGLAYTDVRRTWIYIAEVLDWYGAFNEVRSRFHDRMGLGRSGALDFPASTGIQGRRGAEACLMELLAVTSERHGIGATMVHGSSRQRSACEYGSAFSRAAVLEYGGRRVLHLSGTASIDGDGRTIHVGDYEAQVLETLLCAAAILEEHGARLEDIAQATCFCKDIEAYEAYRRVLRQLSIPVFPCVPVIADVCRDDLLIEIEAVVPLP